MKEKSHSSIFMPKFGDVLGENKWKISNFTFGVHTYFLELYAKE